MRSKFLALLALSVFCFTGCSGNTMDPDIGSNIDSGMNSGAVMSESYEADAYDAAVPETNSAKSMDNSDVDININSESVNPNTNTQVKRIYSGNISLETTKFVNTHDYLYHCAEESGAYLESDDTNKSTAYFAGDNDLYHANMTIRVPADKFEDLLSNIEDCEDVHVTDKSIQTDDISEMYYDIQGRLKSYKVKLKKLQGLLADAQNITEVLDIENAITNTQYEIESLQGQLNSYDSQVRYSVLHVYLNEVNVLDMSSNLSNYHSKLGASVSKGFYSGVNFLSNLLLFVLQQWLMLLLIVIVVIIIYKKTKPKRQAKKLEKQAKLQEERAVRDILIKGSQELSQDSGGQDQA